MPSGSVIAAQHDHGLPAPERECGEAVGEQPHVAGALHDVVRGREQRRAAEREDHRVGVQRPQAAVRQQREVEVERGPQQLRGDQHADGHADDAPDDGHDRELPHDLVVAGAADAVAGGRRDRFGDS